MATDYERRLAGAVECPVCYAEPGDPCMSDDGSEVVPIHESRINDMKELAAQVTRAYADAAVARRAG